MNTTIEDILYPKIKPKNQKEQVLYYLYYWDSFNLKDVINNSMFFKFQTRLSELESEHGQLATREKAAFINKFGHAGCYYTYKAIDKNKILEIYENNH